MRGTWVAQSVRLLTSAQVMISWFVSSSPTLGPLLSVQNRLRILRSSVSLPLSLCPSSTCSFSLSPSLSLKAPKGIDSRLIGSGLKQSPPPRGWASAGWLLRPRPRC